MAKVPALEQCFQLTAPASSPRAPLIVQLSPTELEHHYSYDRSVASALGLDVWGQWAGWGRMGWRVGRVCALENRYPCSPQAHCALGSSGTTNNAAISASVYRGTSLIRNTHPSRAIEHRYACLLLAHCTRGFASGTT